MTYKTLGGGLDLSLSMESKSNSLPLMMSAGGGGGIFKGFWGSIFEHPEVKDGKRRQISPFGVRKPVSFVVVRPFEATSEYTVVFHEIVMYQIVTIRFLDFYLVEGVDSRDAENEGLSLILQFKWLPQGIFWLVDGVKTPPQSCAFTSDCLCFSLGF